MKIKNQIVSDVATGTSPFSVASTTIVTNLNADKVDGLDLPTISGSGSKSLTVNSGATAFEYINKVNGTCTLTVSTTAPSSPITGDVWIDIS